MSGMGQEYVADAVAHSLEQVSVLTLTMHNALGDQSVGCAEEVKKEFRLPLVQFAVAQGLFV